MIVGTTFGVVARQAGLEPIEIVAMSLLIFAGASQFAFVQLWTAGAPAALIVTTVLFLNSRHLLMATSLRPHLQRVSLPRRLAAAFVLTDEAFAMATGYVRRGGVSLRYYVTFAVSLYLMWNLSTIVGLVVGNAIGEPRRFGIDFAITATFLAIVVLAVRRPIDAAVAVLAAAIAGGLALAGASTVAVIGGGALAPILAVAVRR